MFIQVGCVYVSNDDFEHVLVDIGTPTVRVKSSHMSESMMKTVETCADYSKLSLIDRLALEKRQCQEREQELKYVL
jgi:hypothetical protein